MQNRIHIKSLLSASCGLVLTPYVLISMRNWLQVTQGELRKNKTKQNKTKQTNKQTNYSGSRLSRLVLCTVCIWVRFKPACSTSYREVVLVDMLYEF